MFSKILVPYDGSELASKAIEKAKELAKLNSSVEVYVLHVMMVPPKRVPANLFNQVKQAISDEGNKVMGQAKEQLADISNQTQFLLKDGSPYYVILQQAKELNIDLIIIGSRGLSGVKEFLGSVSHSITQQSAIPVLLMK